MAGLCRHLNIDRAFPVDSLQWGPTRAPVPGSTVTRCLMTSQQLIDSPAREYIDTQESEQKGVLCVTGVTFPWGRLSHLSTSPQSPV